MILATPLYSIFRTSKTDHSKKQNNSYIQVITRTVLYHVRSPHCCLTYPDAHRYIPRSDKRKYARSSCICNSAPRTRVDSLELYVKTTEHRLDRPSSLSYLITFVACSGHVVASCPYTELAKLIFPVRLDNHMFA